MKVRELIAELRQHDLDAEVHFAYNYGDHARTTVAPKVETVDEYAVKHSDYHRMPVLDEDGEDQMVVVLQA